MPGPSDFGGPISEGMGRHPSKTGQRTTPTTVSSIDSIGKQLPLLCAASGRDSVRIAGLDRRLGCDLIYAKVMCSSTVRDMMDRGMNFAMYILVIHRYPLTAFAGFTCHNAQCYKPVQNLYHASYTYIEIYLDLESIFFFQRQSDCIVEPLV